MGIMNFNKVINKVAYMKAKVERDSISPVYLGNILDDIIALIRQFDRILQIVSGGGEVLSMQIDTQNDPFIAFGESKPISCRVFFGWEDVTSEVTAWRVTRDSGSPVEDAAWNNGPKAKAFDGNLEITFSQTENDLGPNNPPEGVSFSFTAEINTGEMVSNNLVF